jgi:hypothetical protein
MRPWSARNSFRALLAIPGVLGLVPVSAAGAQAVEARLREGYDSNIYQVASAADSTRVGGPYWRLRLGHRSEKRTQALFLRVRPEGRLQWYPQNSSANEYGAELNALARTLSGRPMLELTASGGYERALFIRRQTREEFQTGAPVQTSPGGSQLPSRAFAAGELGLRFAVTSDVQILGGAFGSWTDYHDSRAGVRAFDSFDARKAGLFLGAEVEAGRSWVFAARGQAADRVYPKREARDADGESVDGTTRRYRDWELDLEGRFRNGSVEHRAIVELDHREDGFAGYYSYDAWSVDNRFRMGLGVFAEIELRYAYGRKRYALYAPGGTPIRNRYHDASCEAVFAPGGMVQLALGAIYDRTYSSDPLFDFGRGGVFAEARFGR